MISKKDKESQSVTFLDLNDTLPDKHLLFLSAADISEVCEPLKQLGINFFCHDRCYRNGAHFRLCNRPDWMQTYYLKRYHNLIYNQFPKESGHTCWSSYKNEPLFIDAREGFNIFNGITIIEKDTHTVDRFGFGSAKKDKCFYEFYHNHLELLYRFILYYKNKATSLINKSEANKILLVENLPFEQAQQEEKVLNKLDSINDFIKTTDIKRYPIKVNKKLVYLSKRESQVCYYLSKGKSAKKIAEILNLSDRTIESYIEVIKIKLHVNYAIEIIKLCENNFYLKSIVEPL
jgi:DNA-binding CsgD family transcriptional regulator